MRICSLLPSATEMIAALGLGDAIVGVSAECTWPPEIVGTPVVTSAKIDPSTLSSVEIDETVRASIADGGSLYAVDAGLIEKLAPDVIVTQDLCAVCAVSGVDIASACPVNATVVSLDPRTYAEVAASVVSLAAALGVTERGTAIQATMHEAFSIVREATQGLPEVSVFFAEWIEPPFCAGHWLPEMIAAAGGKDVLGTAGEPSFPTTWDAVLAREPELIVMGPCGFGVDAALARAHAAKLRLGRPTVVVDGDAYYSRPGPRLAEGVRQLGHLLHPDAVPDPGLPLSWLEAR